LKQRHPKFRSFPIKNYFNKKVSIIFVFYHYIGTLKGCQEKRGWKNYRNKRKNMKLVFKLKIKKLKISIKIK